VDYWRIPEKPWLTRDAVSLLEQWLSPNDVGFEWGSGRSTIWFACRTRHLTSVENNKGWYQRVQQMLLTQELRKLRYEFHETNKMTEADAKDSSYVRAVLSLPDRSLNYALVDGWARDWCCLAVMSKLCVRGLLILDNANWFLPPPKPHLSRAPNSRSVKEGPATEQWAEFWQSVKPWRKIWTSDGITNTLLLFKQ
jgi:hypothetical protein